MPILTTLITSCSGCFDQCNKVRKINRKKTLRSSLFIDNKIWWVENRKQSADKLLELLLGQIYQIQGQHKKVSVFLYAKTTH